MNDGLRSMTQEIVRVLRRIALTVIVTSALASSIGAQLYRSLVRRNEAERQRRVAEINARTARSRHIYEKQRQGWRQWTEAQRRINSVPGGAGRGGE